MHGLVALVIVGNVLVVRLSLGSVIFAVYFFLFIISI